jgi:hypothetical protein
MTNQELKDWKELYKQFKNGYHLSNSDRMELLRLNHRLMEQCHDVHNTLAME